MDSILTSQKTPPFRFLDLPPELRNHIYAEIFTTRYSAYRRIPRYHLAATCLTVLRVSKMVYQEARAIFYQTNTFRFWIPFSGLPLYLDASAKPLTDLMQNVFLDLSDVPSWDFPEALRSAKSCLRRFSDPATPHVRCTFFFWPNSDKFFSEISFLDSLGKLTAFKTVVLKHFGRIHSVQGPTSKTLDEYLSVMLGPGELSFEVHDWRFGQSQCLTYHPCQRAYGVKGKEVTD